MKEYKDVRVPFFDELRGIMERIYDKETKIFFEPKSKVEYVMVKGLMKAWKHIIYDFHTDRSEDHFDFIMRLESALVGAVM